MGIAQEFKARLANSGLWTAMKWLNESVPYRFSAVFAFRGDSLHNVCLVDKENPSITNCSDQPISDSYCVYVHRTGERFSVEHAMLDRRVEDHPKRQTFQCYYGIPLFDLDGKVVGTVCHFDRDPVHVTEDCASALDDVGSMIAQAAFGDTSKRTSSKAAGLSSNG
jgi:GAF domain-containing protein